MTLMYVRDPHDTDDRKPQTFAVGERGFHGMILFVGKPKRQMFMTDEGGLYYRQYVTIAYMCPDGYVRKGRFCQPLRDKIVPGKHEGFHGCKRTDPTQWPHFGDDTSDV